MADVLRNPIPSPMTAEPTPATMGDVPGPSIRKASAPNGISVRAEQECRAQAEPGEVPGRERGPDRPAQHHHGQREAGHQRGPVQYALHIHGQEGGEADDRHTAQQRRGVRRRDRSPRPQAEGHHRIGGAPFLDHDAIVLTTQTPAAPAMDRTFDVPSSVKAIMSEATAIANRAAPATSTRRFWRATSSCRKATNPAERAQADRHVDPEDPGPAQVLDDQAAGQRPEHGRHAPDARQPALDVPPPCSCTE